MSIRLGIIGTGIAARDLHLPVIQRMGDSFEIVALANRSPEKAESFAQRIGVRPRITSDYRELLSWPEVDAVDLALPITLNAKVTIDSLRAGKHVIVEKPIAGSVADGRSVVAAADLHPDRVLLVAENVRYDLRYRLAQTLIADGHIGRPVMIHHDVLDSLSPTNPYASTAWRQHPEHIGGYLSDGGVHQTAALHMLVGPVRFVHGMTTSFRPVDDPTDTLLANLHLESGVVGHLTYSVGLHKHEPSPLRLFGTEGSLAIYNDRVFLSTREREQEYPFSPVPSGLDLEFGDFYRAVMEGKPLDATPRDALEDLRVIDAILRSGRESRPIRMDEEQM